MTTNERLQAYTGEGLEVGMLTLAEARERYDSAEVEVTDAGHRTITVGEPIEVEWSETPVAGANAHLSDGVLGYWATVPATWTEAQVRAAFLETADYDTTPRIAVTLREGNEWAACFAGCIEEEGQTDDRVSEDADAAAREAEANEQIADENDAALDAEASFAAHARKTNAIWSSTSARSEIKVWADGGCIWAQRPADPTVAEQATYEATDHDDNGLECAWQVIVNGKVDGSLRFPKAR